MRFLLLVVFFLAALSGAVKAQTQFPAAETPLVDALLDEAYAAHGKKDEAGVQRSLKQVDSLLAGLKGDFPLYRGVVHLFESFYTFDKSERGRYSVQGRALLSGGGPLLADSFSTALYNVMQLFYKGGRRSEWRGADSVFRIAVAGAGTPDALRYGVLNYAGKKLDQKQFAVSRTLALYDYYTLLSRNSSDPLDKLVLMFDDWLVLKGNLEQWKNLPLEEKYPEDFRQQRLGYLAPQYVRDEETKKWLRGLDFRSTFKTLISRMKELTKELVLENAYGSSGWRGDWRAGYYRVYSYILNDYYAWAVGEQKESVAILPFKEFLYQDLVPNEIEAAAGAGKKPVVKGGEVVALFSNLARLYHNIGNGFDEKETALYGVDVLLSHKVFTTDEENQALVTLLQNRVSADRLQRHYEASLKSSQSLKKFARLPDSATVRQREKWEYFMNVRIEEIYTLLAAGKAEATDSLAALMDRVAPLDNGSENAPLYGMRAWPHLQYLVATIKAQHGQWMPGLLVEAIGDMDRLEELPEIYFPVQLLYLKARWREEKQLSESLLSNLLFYTGRQLRYTFPMLAAEDRMRLFEQKLSQFFDVYHELLFAGSLDAYPGLKDKVIAQSLSLKNALVDGNLIPNELLETKGSNFSVKEIEQLRDLRQEVNLYLQEGRLKKQGTGERRKLQDRVQNMWLELLEDSGMDSLRKLTDWRQVSKRLKPGAVYTEVIRYNRWLSDSAAYYGAYIISPDGRLSLVPLFTEAGLAALLKDPAASPQTAALDTDGNRGGILLVPAQPARKTFRKGDVDRLGELLLKPLWPYLQGKEEWLLVQDGLLNRISFAALQWKSRSLFEYLQLRQLSGSYSLFQPVLPLPAKAPALLVGGLHYGAGGTAGGNTLFKPSYSWNYLPGTRKEVQSLQAQFTASGYRTRVLTGSDFPDSAMMELKQYPIIHLATHGFYLDSASAAAVYADRWGREAVKYEPLFRCGLAVSHANGPGERDKSDGYLLGYELANVDLRKCYLVTFSACETGLGDVRNNLGVDGLSRALKLSGARHLLISLWKVPDEPTAVFMEQFYQHLFAGKAPAQALRATQSFMSKTYAATDWAAFVLVQ
ncbi:MAG TPA: CHAT domain-containing protein [Chitinophagaceae bacterium]